MCSVQQESLAFSSDHNSAAEDSIKMLIVLLYSTLFLCMCVYFEVLTMFRKKSYECMNMGTFTAIVPQ